MLYFYLQDFVSYYALDPFQMGCLVELLCQPERVQISPWFPKEGTKIMTDWGRQQCSGIGYIVLAGHMGPDNMESVVVMGTIVSTVNKGL